MAPKKRKAEEQSAKPSATTTSMRVTRSASQRAAKGSAETPAAVELSKNKKGKAAGKQAKVKAEERVEIVIEDKEKEEAKGKAIAGRSTKKTVVIEHCKQCNSFKKSATELKKHLEKAVPGITVLLNPDRPQKYCFEIREEGGETFIRLLDITVPRDISDIVDKVKEPT